MEGIVRDKESCSLCLSCLRYCPSKAIALAKKRVIKERCIQCGNCLFFCPEQHYQSSQLESAKKILKSPFKKIALVNPLLASALLEASPEQIAEAIYRLGFDEVYLVPSGLELIRESYQEFLGKTKIFPLISSQCPVVVSYVEKFYPDLINHLVPVLNPELASLRYLEETIRPAEIVLISACPGQGSELEEHFSGGAVLTFAELRQWLQESHLEPAKLPLRKFQSLNLSEGSFFIMEGDLLRVVAGREIESESDFLSTSGIEQVRLILESVRLGEIRAKLVELSFCSGGCIGSLALGTRLAQRLRKERVEKYLKAWKQAEQTRLRLVSEPKIDLKIEFSHKRLQISEPGNEKIKSALASLGLGSELPLINCQACGYTSCTEFGKALVLGNAEPDYCFPALVRKMTRVDERLLRSERLASVGQIASALAHEVNNPLGLASGYAQAIVGDKRLPRELKEIIGLIKEEIENASSIIQNLLSLSRERPVKFERVNLHEVLSATLRLIAPRLETNGIALKLKYLPHPIFLEADPYALQQVFTNIVLNACQAMERGGTLYVSVQESPDSVAVSFRDTGIGIKPEHLDRLFDPFFTTKGPGEGTGLGLTIAYNLIERHRGDIQVKSEWGKGAEFIVVLPRTQAQVQSGSIKS